MAKHKRKLQQNGMKNDKQYNMNGNMANNMNNNPFGIDPLQLINLLGGNLDINGILSSMNNNGFNMGNFGPSSQISGMNNSSNYDDYSSNASYSEENLDDEYDEKVDETSDEDIEDMGSKNMSDPNLEFLISVRSFAHPDRIKFINKIIDLYSKGKIK